MKEAAQNLRSVIQTKGGGIVVDMLYLPNAYDYAALSDAFLNYLAEHAGENIALNVTGGTTHLCPRQDQIPALNSKGLRPPVCW